MNLEDAIRTPESSQSNCNVRVWAKPESYSGTQPRFQPDNDAVIELQKPDGYEEFWYLSSCAFQLSQGSTPQQIIDMVHSFYRVPAPLENPFY